MRMSSTIESIDPRLGWRVEYEHAPSHVDIARKLLKCQNRGEEIFSPQILTKIKSYGRPVSFEDYCEVIMNYPELKQEAIERNKRLKEREALARGTGSYYHIPDNLIICDKINEAKNPYQECYDRLFFNSFRNYVEWLLDKRKSPFDSRFLKRIPLTQEDRHWYFKRTYDLVELLFNPLLSEEEKKEMINKQHTLMFRRRYSREGIIAIIAKQNKTPFSKQELQQILDLWLETHAKRGIKQIKSI